MVKTSIVGDEKALKKWPKFEKAVTENPFYHPKHRRIMKFNSPSYPDETWRYRDDPLRVLYIANKEDRIVYPLEAGTVTSMSYKKRSKK